MFYKIDEKTLQVVRNILADFPTKDLRIGEISNITVAINILGALEVIPEPELEPEPEATNG